MKKSIRNTQGIYGTTNAKRINFSKFNPFKKQTLLKSIFVVLSIFLFSWIAIIETPNTFAQNEQTKCTSGALSEDNRKVCKEGVRVCNKGGKVKGTNKDVCCGLKLNTNVPFIGRCVSVGGNGAGEEGTNVTQLTAFPVLMGGLTKIMITLILAISFLSIIAGGVMMIIGGANDEYYKKGKHLIKVVIYTIAALGSSGIILRLINPNFFGI